MQENFETTFEKLFKKSYPMLFCYAQKIVGYDDAADVVEEVFCDVWKRREAIDLGDKIHSFLYRAVYTRCINVINKAQYHPRIYHFDRRDAPTTARHARR